MATTTAATAYSVLLETCSDIHGRTRLLYNVFAGL